MSTSVLGQWPQWGGPNRDFKSDAKGLAAKWPDDGPKRVWSRPLGDGLSSIAMDDGKLFTMYREGEEEIVIAIDAASGKTIWQNKYPAKVADSMDTRFGVGPRSTPTVAGDHVYTLGVAGRLRCGGKKDGKTVGAHPRNRALVVQGKGFGLPGYFRASCCVEDHVLEGAIAGFRAVAQELGTP